jgi:hypothetical protein
MKDGSILIADARVTSFRDPSNLLAWKWESIQEKRLTLFGNDAHPLVFHDWDGFECLVMIVIMMENKKSKIPGPFVWPPLDEK